MDCSGGHRDIDPVYRPLANPAGLVFFLFISLSTLRLNRALCWVSGLTAALSYLASAAYLGWRPTLLAAVCRAYARGTFSRSRGLPEAMEQLNGELISDVGEGRFVTLVAVVCVPGCPRVERFSAGHGPLFIYSLSQDRFEEIGAQGLPLGISSQFISEPPMILELDAGDLLVLATDGFFEWTNGDGEQFGVKRIEETIRESREKRPAELIATLYEAVRTFSAGTKQQDDLTAVVIKRT